MDYQNISKKVESFIKDLFDSNHQDYLLFHNLGHTVSVVERANEIAAQYDLSERDHFIISTAAWFHDTGHLFVDPAVHEVKSVELMKGFFSRYPENDRDLISNIETCIMSTQMPRNPKTVPEQILSDADTYHLGTSDFKSTNKRIRKEYILRKVYPRDDNWDRKSLDFMESHQYYTPYCQNLLEAGKQKNIEKLRKKTLKGELERKEIVVEKKEDPVEENPKENKQRTSLLNKGIQTMLRLTSDNHLELSGMADGKANILISVNAIIISVILSVLIRRLEVDTYLTIPTIIFLIFSLGTIVIAILATRPKINEGRFSKEDILNKKTNLLFFGNFHKATLKEYEWGMREMMKDEDYLYGALIKDIYYLGVVLGRKYKLIRLAYFIFMIGIIISVLAFALAVILNRGGTPPNSATMPL